MNRYIKSTPLLILIMALGVALSAQDTRLANQYYRSGEYEKAAATYLKLYKQSPRNTSLFDNYINSLIELEDYDGAEKALKQEIKSKPDNTTNHVTYGNLLERQDRTDEALKMYKKGIDDLPNSASTISNVARTFTRLGKYDLALETYLKGLKILGDGYHGFDTSIAQVYQRLGETEKMIKHYLTAAAQQPSQVKNYKSNFKFWLKSDEEIDELKKQLYERMQESPENNVYPELMEWVFIEKEDYNGALRQARSLDRKLNETGTRVLNVGYIARNDGDLETAIKAFDYIIEKKGIENPNYIVAHSGRLKLMSKLALKNNDAAMMDTVDVQYARFIDEMGVNSTTDYLVKDYADFLALHKNDMDKAVEVLEGLVQLASINKTTRASSKIALADYYLMSGDIWEATLLYSQVDKEFEEGHQGEVARFKNAMLFYYAGEFAWAQEQFDILESATSKLISNDAIDMSIFIMDNMGLDTTDIPLKIFAEAQLLTVQNRFDEASKKLGEITATYPEHDLQDDILYQRAEMHYQQREYQKALELYTQVYTEFNEEIRADNALMKAAELYETELDDVEKAKELYEKLYVDFSNSTFAVEARKRYRILRGDDV